MSTAHDRMTIIQENYLAAVRNEPHDLSMANTPELVIAVQNHLASAKHAYFSAVALELTCNSASVETAYTDAQAALVCVKQARKDAMKIAMLLDMLTTATRSVNKLVSVASSI